MHPTPHRISGPSHLLAGGTRADSHHPQLVSEAHEGRARGHGGDRVQSAGSTWTGLKPPLSRPSILSPWGRMGAGVTAYENPDHHLQGTAAPTLAGIRTWSRGPRPARLALESLTACSVPSAWGHPARGSSQGPGPASCLGSLIPTTPPSQVSLAAPRAWLALSSGWPGGHTEGCWCCCHGDGL